MLFECVEKNLSSSLPDEKKSFNPINLTNRENVIFNDNYIKSDLKVIVKDQSFEFLEKNSKILIKKLVKKYLKYKCYDGLFSFLSDLPDLKSGDNNDNLIDFFKAFCIMKSKNLNKSNLDKYFLNDKMYSHFRNNSFMTYHDIETLAWCENVMHSFACKFILNDLDYKQSLKCSILDSKIKSNPKILFTITTCKRLDLFKKTMASFFRCFQDYHLISKYICIDDGSDEADIEEMKRLYPFFTFHIKNSNHCDSMNVVVNYAIGNSYDIVENNNTDFDYNIHMEDDFCFFEKRNYISESISVLESNEKYGQIMFCRNYQEVPNYQQNSLSYTDKISCLNVKDFDLDFFKYGYYDILEDVKNEYYKISILLKKDFDFDLSTVKINLSFILEDFKNLIDSFNNEVRYYEHTHVPSRSQESQNLSRTGLLNSNYWFGYSLRPNLTKVSLYKDIGKFIPSSSFFERDYAEQSYILGYKTVFLDTFSHYHTGPKTWENKKINNNVYAMKDVSQFDNKQDNITETIFLYYKKYNKELKKLKDKFYTEGVKYKVIKLEDLIFKGKLDEDFLETIIKSQNPTLIYLQYSDLDEDIILKNYDYYVGQDVIGFDIFHMPDYKNIEELKLKCEELSGNAFNTLGFIKKIVKIEMADIPFFHKDRAFGLQNGIYINAIL